MQNEPGVLSRVSGTLAGRGFNIDSLVVCRTEIRDLSRMCIVISGQDGVVEQARRQLEDMVRFTSLFSYMIYLTCLIGSRLGSSGLYGNQGYFARTSPCQGIHPWS